MKQTLKLWTGVGACIVVGVGAMTLAHAQTGAAGDNVPQLVAQAGEGGEGGEGGEASAQSNQCAAIAVEGGGEGGES